MIGRRNEGRSRLGGGECETCGASPPPRECAASAPDEEGAPPAGRVELALRDAIPEEGDPAETGGEWRRQPWDRADPVPERSAVVARVRRTLGRERFALTVEQVQDLFQQVLDPFEILPRAGVFLSNGRNHEVMFEAFIDLWNYTGRWNLAGRSPVEALRRSALATGRPPDRREVRESLIALSPHNLDLLHGFDAPTG